MNLIAEMAKVNYAPTPTETARLVKEAQEAVAPITRPSPRVRLS